VCQKLDDQRRPWEPQIRTGDGVVTIGGVDGIVIAVVEREMKTIQ